MVVVSRIGLAAALIVIAGGVAWAQNGGQTQTGGLSHYEQHNLGPTGCDIVVQGHGRNPVQLQVHFDEGQRKMVQGQPLICRNGQIVAATAPSAQ